MVGARGIESLGGAYRHPATSHDKDVSTDVPARVGVDENQATQSVNPRQSQEGPTSTNHSNCFQMADPELIRLTALWPTLSSCDRIALLALAESLGRKVGDL
jgi:hypothetical protein